MKKQLAVLGAFAIVGGMTFPAHAGFFDGLMSKAKAGLTKTFDSAVKTASKAATGLVNKAASAAKKGAATLAAKAKEQVTKATKAVGSIAHGVLDRFASIATNYVSNGGGKVSGWIKKVGGDLAKRLPGFMQPWAHKAIAWGAGGATKIANGINGLIAKAVGKGHELVKLGIKGADKFAKDLIAKLQGSVNRGIDIARGYANGKIQKAGGRITQVFKGIGASFGKKLTSLVKSSKLVKLGKKR